MSDRNRRSDPHTNDHPQHQQPDKHNRKADMTSILNVVAHFVDTRGEKAAAIEREFLDEVHALLGKSRFAEHILGGSFSGASTGPVQLKAAPAPMPGADVAPAAPAVDHPESVAAETSTDVPTEQAPEAQAGVVVDHETASPSVTPGDAAAAQGTDAAIASSAS